MVHEDDEFAHDGGEGDKRFFARRPQAQVKLFEDAAMAHGTQGGHVEGAPRHAASTTDVPHSLEPATVAVVWGHARQRGGGGRGKPAQLRHFGQYGDRNHGADTGNGFEPVRLVPQGGVGGDERGQLLVAVGDLPVQGFEQLPRLPNAQGVGVMLGVVALGIAHLDQLPPPLGEVGQALPGGGGWRGVAAGWKVTP